MDIKVLMELYRKERMSPYLQDVGDGFYTEMESAIKELKLQYEECLKRGEISKQTTHLKELENVKSVIKDLYEIRERKVILGALNYVRRDGEEIELENLTEEERKMLDEIIDVLKNSRKTILESSKGGEIERPPEKRPSKEKAPKKGINFSLVTLRITKSLPSIVGADGKVYGSFEEEDIVSLPDANAMALIKQGAAEEIKL